MFLFPEDNDPSKVTTPPPPEKKKRNDSQKLLIPKLTKVATIGILQHSFIFASNYFR